MSKMLRQKNIVFKAIQVIFKWFQVILSNSWNTHMTCMTYAIQTEMTADLKQFWVVLSI